MFRNTNNDYYDENRDYSTRTGAAPEDYQLGGGGGGGGGEQNYYRKYNNRHHRHRQNNTEFLDEPPLLQELEIYPQRIIEKSLAILNPFHARGLSDNPRYLFHDNDLAGPIFFFIIFAVCLILTGHQANFSYIYGLSMISITLMYFLITLMCNSVENFISLSGVASILGYSILPIVWIGIFGIFIQLKSMAGFLLIVMSVTLSTKGASKTFCLMINEPEQRYLIGYPCALLYMIFALLLVF